MKFQPYTMPRTGLKVSVVGCGENPTSIIVKGQVDVLVKVVTILLISNYSKRCFKR